MTSDIYLHFLLCVYFMVSALRASQAQCEETLTAAVALGGIADFYICDTAASNDTLTIQFGASTILKVLSEELTDGWYWETSVLGGYSVIHVYLFVDSADDYAEHDVAYDSTTTNSIQLRELTLYHQGPPQLCNSTDRANADFVQTLTAPINSSDSSTLCVVSQSELQLTPTKVWSPSCDVGNNESSTFTVTAVQYPDNSVVYDLVFSVTSLLDEDIGDWTLDVSNDDGNISVAADVDIIGTELCQADTTQDLLTLEGHFSSTATSSVYLLSSNSLSQSDISLRRSSQVCTGDDYPDTNFTATVQAKNESSGTYELVLQVSDLSKAEVKVTVANDLQLEYTINVTGPPVLCEGLSDNRDPYIAAADDPLTGLNVGCILAPDGHQVSLVNMTKSNATTDSYSVTAELSQDTTCSLRWDVIISSPGVKEEDFDLWTVYIESTYSGRKYTLAFDFTLDEAEAATGSDEDNSGDGSSINWLALGIGLPLGVTVIVLAVAVVLLCVKKARNGPVTGESREDVDRTRYEYDINLAGLKKPSNNDAEEPTQSRSGPVVTTPSDEYLVPAGGNLTSQDRPDHAEATPGEYVTMDSELPASNRSDHNVPTTSPYLTVSADFPFTRATRTISDGTSDRGQPEMTYGPYDLCNSVDTEPPNVRQRMDDESYVNLCIDRESGGARETYANVASAYENAA